jgi:hypothetical protein
MIKGERRTALKPIAIGVATAVLAMQSLSANAANFKLGKFDVTFDSTFSAGAAYRIEDRDFENLIGKTNNQEFSFQGYLPYAPLYSSADIWATKGSYSTNGDLGNLNYDPGESFSEVIKGFHELNIRGENYGAVVSFMYYKDFAAEGIGHQQSVYGSESDRRSFDVCRDEEAESLVCQDFRVLDAYLYGEFDFNDGNNPLSVRVGEQVLSWGESTLIPHGINVSPVDIARLNAPGADLKEAFIPTGMVWANLGLSDALTLEAFYQYEWQKTRLPVPGSYFASNDFAGAGGQHQTIQLGFAANPDMDRDDVMAGLNGIGGMLAADPSQAAALSQAYLAYATKYAIRDSANDKEARDDGQFGVKLGWFAEDLNYSEFGFYFINYHSRRPLISGVTSDFTAGGIGADMNTLAVGAASGGLTVDQFTNLNAFTKGIIVFPEDIKLYGFSFNTTFGTTAISGEISYRQDEPLQIDDAELLFAAMPQQLADSGLRPELDGISQYGRETVEGCDMSKTGPGMEADGFCLLDTVQAQATAIHSFGPSFGFDNLNAVFEIGYISIIDMPSQDVLRFNAPGTDRSGSDTDTVSAGLLGAVQGGVATDQHFPTDTAWGYRVILAGEFNRVFGEFNVKPRFTFKHDVDGITPDPLFLFHEDKKSASLAVEIDYQSKWSFGFGYNSFFGGVGSVNSTADRDYVSFNIKYSM